MADNNKILDHDYDGIKEYDNPLPNWWLTTFFVTIIFAFIYYIHYQFGGGWTLDQHLQEELGYYQSLQKSSSQAQKTGGQETEEQLAALMDQAEAQKSGQAIYMAKCAACHGDAGQGLVGPNLTDRYWIHGKGTRKDILQFIRVGVGEKGMPPWDTMLKPEDVIAVSAFTYALKGTQPGNPKAPQGEEVP
jgi:cytochrome c oxidase cbb3-type subunit 3